MAHGLQLALLLAAVLLAAKLAGALGRLIGVPASFGPLLAGVLLGPSAVNLIRWRIFAENGHPDALLQGVGDLAGLGAIFILFLAGMETDLRLLRRVALAVTGSGVGGVLVALLSGTLAARAFHLGWYPSLFIGTTLSGTSVSVSAQTLLELGRVRSREGAAILGAAVVDDFAGVIVLTIMVAVAAREGGAWRNTGEAGLVIAKMLLFLVAGALLGGALLQRLGRLAKAVTGQETLLATGLAVALTYAWAADYLGGMAVVTGAYLAGVLFGRTSFREEVGTRLWVLNQALFAPVFLVSIGLQVDLHALGGAGSFTAVIGGTAVLSKLLGAGLGARLGGMTWPEALRVGSGLVCRGEVALAVARIGLSYGLIDQRVYTVMVAVTLATALVTPLLMLVGFAARPAAAPRT